MWRKCDAIRAGLCPARIALEKPRGIAGGKGKGGNRDDIGKGGRGGRFGKGGRAKGGQGIGKGGRAGHGGQSVASDYKGGRGGIAAPD